MPPTLRNIEELLFERGYDVCQEIVPLVTLVVIRLPLARGDKKASGSRTLEVPFRGR